MHKMSIGGVLVSPIVALFFPDRPFILVVSPKKAKSDLRREEGPRFGDFYRCSGSKELSLRALCYYFPFPWTTLP